MHLKYTISFLALFIIFSTNSCSITGNETNPAENIVNMRVNHFRQTGIGEGPYLVYLIQEEEKIGEEDWTFLYDEIEGFEYELGFIYDIKVRKVEIENPPMDASSIKYILVNVRSKERVPEDQSFEINLKEYGQNFVTGTDEELALLDKYKIDCGEKCEELLANLDSKERLTATFIHGPAESLVLQSFY